MVFPVMNDEGVDEVVRRLRKLIKSVCYYKGNIWKYSISIFHFAGFQVYKIVDNIFTNVFSRI